MEHLNFCTLFDANYLTRALVLYDSLKAHSPPFRLYCLCLDQASFDEVQRLSGTHTELKPIALADLEAAEPELLLAKQNRSLVEYYFTLSPVLPNHVMLSEKLDHITLLDADLQFHASPMALYDELGEGSILMTEHRYAPDLIHLLPYGRFNVQYETFRNDKNGRACLAQWRQQCLEWCFDRLEGNRFADQAYLNSWPKDFRGVVVSELAEAGVALWNLNGVSFAHRSAEQENGGNRFLINGEPLLFFHFHSLKYLTDDWFMNDFSNYHVTPTPALNELYQQYIKALDEVVGKYNVPARHGRGNSRSRLPLGLQVLKQFLKGNLIRKAQ